MDYGNPKTLPVAGSAAIGAAALTHQWWIIGIAVIVVVLAAIAVRHLWRKRKNLDDK